MVTFSLVKKSGSPMMTEHELANRLRQFGWIVPAYTMAPDLEHVSVLRVVVREDFTRSQAEKLVNDIEFVMEQINVANNVPKLTNSMSLGDDQLPQMSLVEQEGYASEGQTLRPMDNRGKRARVIEQLQKLRPRGLVVKEPSTSTPQTKHHIHKHVPLRKTRSIC